MSEPTPMTRRALRRAESVPAQRERPLTRRELRAVTDPEPFDAPFAEPAPEPFVAPEAEHLEPPAIAPLPFRGPGAARADHGGFVPAPLETPDAPFGSPAVFRDAPVLPALRPLETLQETAIPSPRPAPLPVVALPPLSLPYEPVPEPVAAPDELTFVLPYDEPLSLAERIAALPVAPGVVEINLEAIPHPSEPLDNKLPRRAPHVTDPAPLPARPARAARAATRQTPPAADGPMSFSVPLGGDPEQVDLLDSGRKPGPPVAFWALVLGIASVVLWPLGPVAMGLGGWTLRLARQAGFSLVRPMTGLIGGALGTLLAAGFVVFGM